MLDGYIWIQYEKIIIALHNMINLNKTTEKHEQKNEILEELEKLYNYLTKEKNETNNY